MGVKVGLVSLGCPKNLVDSEVMLGILKEKGYFITTNLEEAEIFIVNTCAFIRDAEVESIDVIKQLGKAKEGGKSLLVAGCLSQRYGKGLFKKIKEIDGILGTGEVEKVEEAIRRVRKGGKYFAVNEPGFLYDHSVPRLLSTPGHYAYIKIAEGCNNNCSFCTIPKLRGRYRSRKMESILKEAEHFAKKGVKEIILIAQDTTFYGKDISSSFQLAGLLKELVKIKGIAWIRLLYTYPTHFTEELIRVIAEEKKICKYLDVPLQHADNEILTKMGRRGKVEDYFLLIKRLRSAIANLCIRTCFIVGFPGEKKEHFSNLCDFVKKCQFDKLGLFCYSQEEGTTAALFPGQVSEGEKEERFRKIMKLQQEISAKKLKGFLEKRIPVIVDGKINQDNLFFGRSQFEAPEVDGIIFIRDGGLLSSGWDGKTKIGSIVEVKITKTQEYDLIGQIVDN